MKVKVCSATLRYQVSVYRAIGPLVKHLGCPTRDFSSLNKCKSK